MGKALQEDDLLARKSLLLNTHDLANELADLANSGDELAHRWIYRLHKYGTTRPVLSMVNPLVRKVEAVSTYQLDKETGKFVASWDVWSKSLKEKPIFPSRETIFAWIVMRIINDDIAGKVKRCKAPLAKQKRMARDPDATCPNYFFGLSNRHYCSKTCGTRVRVANRRRANL